MPSSTNEHALILALQQGIPIAQRPFRALAEQLETNETELIDLAHQMQADGRARRFGGIFDTPRIASSTLCAIDAEDPTHVAAQIVRRSSVTHCYSRTGRPNLWFTLTTARAGIENEIASIHDITGHAVLNFPMRQRFKLGVILDPRGVVVAPPLPTPPRAPVALSPTDRLLIHRLQGQLPVCAEPFKQLAEDINAPQESILNQLLAWQQSGILRRIALVCRHRKLGFNGNLMAVWCIPPSQLDAAAELLSLNGHVSHCYEREPADAFPFNLYAMMHADTPESIQTIARQIDADLGHPPHRTLHTLKEYKKASPRPFSCEFEEPLP